jgi:hypothetical protein
MDHLHPVVWLAERLAQGDPVTWGYCVVLVIVSTIAFLQDLRRAKKRRLSALKRNGQQGDGMLREGVVETQIPPTPPPIIRAGTR